MNETPVALEPTADAFLEHVDHPDDLADDEAQRGHAVWSAIDDLDDDDNGIDEPASTTMRGLMGAAATGREHALARARVLKRVLLAHGVPEVSIELQPGRPTSGDEWNACRPVSPFSHHIASAPTPANPTPGLWLVKHGRSDLPGPLCNGTAGVDLVYRIICMGLANHPGYGGPLVVSGPLGAYTIPKDDARPYAWGTEYEGGFSEAVWDRTYTNARTGKTMTFREFMGRVNAGLVEGIWAINGRGKTPKPGMDLSTYHCEHKTWAPDRKPDRLGYDTAAGRREISKYANTPQEDEVSAEDVWSHKINTDAGDVAAGVALRRTLTQSARGRTAAEAALEQANRNRAAIAAIGQRLDGLAPGISQAVIEALGDEVKVNVDVSFGGPEADETV